MTAEDIEQRVGRALSEFVRLHAAILELNLHERTLCQHLAGCLAPEFPGWDVDCEYNRMLDKIKKSAWRGDEALHKVFPDIIVHHRKEIGPGHDLLAIEAKRWNSAASEKADDIKKLEAFKRSPFEYQFALPRGHSAAWNLQSFTVVLLVCNSTSVPSRRDWPPKARSTDH
jgi:hypothetical protein